MANKNLDTVGDIEFKSVQFRKIQKKNRPVSVVGNCAESDTVQGIVKCKTLHVSRLNPATNAEDLHKFLAHRITYLKCQPLQSRYPDTYSFFKVLIPQGEFDRIKDAGNWPRNA